jgi:ADP-ribose pyrophosphatase
MWKIKSRKTVFSSGPCKLDELTVQDPHGKLRTRILLSLGGDSVLIIPRDKQGNYHLCRQPRIGFGDVLEFPSGGIKRGETPQIAAKRELKEELGISGRLTYKGYFVPIMGIVDLKVHVFGCSVSKIELQNPESYEKITMIKVSPKKLSGLIKKHKLVDGYSLAALRMEFD